MALYLFNAIEIHDAAEYARYVELATPVFVRMGVKVLGNDEEARFNGLPGDKAVLLEFRDKAHMKAFMEDPDYVKAAVHRDKGTTMNIAVFRQFPQPA